MEILWKLEKVHAGGGARQPGLLLAGKSLQKAPVRSNLQGQVGTKVEPLAIMKGRDLG